MLSSLIHAPRLSSTNLINPDGYSCKLLKEFPMQILFTPLKAPFIFLFITSFQLTVTPKITIERCLPQHNYYCFGCFFAFLTLWHSFARLWSFSHSPNLFVWACVFCARQKKELKSEVFAKVKIISQVT